MTAELARKRKIEALGRWEAGMAKEYDSAEIYANFGGVAGTGPTIVLDGINYEKFELENGGYIVVQWNDDGIQAIGG